MEKFILLTALLLNASANILVKLSSKTLVKIESDSIYQIIYTIFTNPIFILGVTFFALNLILYTIALSKINLSIAYPIMTSGGFLIITLFSLFYLKENITLSYIIGIILIIIGVFLVASNLK